MRLTRLSLLMLALVVSVLVAPQAFGAKRSRAALTPAQTTSLAAECYTVDCGDGRTTPCCNSVEYCLGYCYGYCGVAPGTCIDATSN